MSEPVQLALIGWASAFSVALVTLAGIILTHILGRRDRALASDTVKAKNDELTALKATHATEVADLRTIIARQARQLAELGVIS